MNNLYTSEQLPGMNGEFQASNELQAKLFVAHSVAESRGGRLEFFRNGHLMQTNPKTGVVEVLVSLPRGLVNVFFKVKGGAL